MEIGVVYIGMGVVYIGIRVYYMATVCFIIGIEASVMVCSGLRIAA